jgi:hypothetical protein
MKVAERIEHFYRNGSNAVRLHEGFPCPHCKQPRKAWAENGNRRVCMMCYEENGFKFPQDATYCMTDAEIERIRNLESLLRAAAPEERRAILAELERLWPGGQLNSQGVWVTAEDLSWFPEEKEEDRVGELARKFGA